MVQTQAHSILPPHQWEHAIKLADQNRAIFVPIVISDDKDKYPAFATKVYPNEMHYHPRSPRKRTVRETIERIFQIQALFLRQSRLEEDLERLVHSGF